MEPNGILAKRSAYGQNLVQHGARPPMDHAGVHHNFTHAVLQAANDLAASVNTTETAADGGEISK